MRHVTSAMSPVETSVQEQPSAATPALIGGPEHASYDRPRAVAIVEPAWLTAALNAQTSQTKHVPKARPACASEPLLVEGFAALAAPSRTLYSCCDDTITDSELHAGCMHAQGCVLFVSEGERWKGVKSARELARVLGPVRSPAEAFGRAVLVEDDQILTPKDSTPQSPGQGDPILLDMAYVTQDEAGFKVTTPVSPFCGCEHPIEVQNYEIDHDGVVTLGKREISLTTQILGACVD